MVLLSVCSSHFYIFIFYMCLIVIILTHFNLIRRNVESNLNFCDQYSSAELAVNVSRTIKNVQYSMASCCHSFKTWVVCAGTRGLASVLNVFSLATEYVNQTSLEPYWPVRWVYRSISHGFSVHLSLTVRRLIPRVSLVRRIFQQKSCSYHDKVRYTVARIISQFICVECMVNMKVIAS